jgi:hypothetical protein
MWVNYWYGYLLDIAKQLVHDEPPPISVVPQFEQQHSGMVDTDDTMIELDIVSEKHKVGKRD